MTVRKSDPIGVALGSKITKPDRDQNQPFWQYSDMERNIDRNLRIAKGKRAGSLAFPGAVWDATASFSLLC